MQDLNSANITMEAMDCEINTVSTSFKNKEKVFDENEFELSVDFEEEIDEDDFDSDIVCRYWHDIIDDLPHETMVTDGHTMYPPLFKEFNMEQALCVFHAIYNVRDKPYKDINNN